MLAALVVYPLDTISIRLIADAGSGPPAVRGAWDCLAQTWRGEGLPGFYKGVSLVPLNFFSYRLGLCGWDRVKRVMVPLLAGQRHEHLAKLLTFPIMRARYLVQSQPSTTREMTLWREESARSRAVVGELARTARQQGLAVVFRGFFAERLYGVANLTLYRVCDTKMKVCPRSGTGSPGIRI
jgi:hypothetical protein